MVIILSHVMAGLKGQREEKKSKKIKDFNSFDSLIDWDDVHTFYLNEGQCTTDKDLWKLIIMYTNGYSYISYYGYNRKIEK